LALEALTRYVNEDDICEGMPGNEPWVETKYMGEAAITAIKQALAAPVQSCYCPNCEAMGKELAALKAQSHANDLTHDQWDAWQDKHGLILERDALDDLLSMLAAQPAPVPLTDEQIRWHWSNAHNDTTDRMAFEVFARAIEAHHGITKGGAA
jgi:hypothetical protein